MNFKNFFPSDSYMLTTKLSVDEVKIRLSESINQPKKFLTREFNNPLTRQYEGQLFNNTFKINQIIVGKRNSFAPLITGSITSYHDTTNIKIKMELLPFVITFMFLWLSSVGLVCVVLLSGGLLHLPQIIHDGFSPFLLIPFVMFIFGCFLPFSGFKTESENSKYYLIKLLDGQEQAW